MEIKVNIPQNDYKEVTEIREWVVQEICNILLRGDVFHPTSGGRCRNADRVIHLAQRGLMSGFGTLPGNDNTYVRIHSCEVKAAVTAFKNAGYYLFECYEYGSWIGYKIDKYPSIERGRRVEEIPFTADFD